MSAVSFSPKGSCEKDLCNLLASAKNSVDIAIYSFTNQAIAQAILDTAKRGIPVRIVFDRTETHGTQATFHDQFEAAGIPIKLYSPSGGIMHDKFTIVDGHLVENGSFNYTERAQNENWENIQIHDDPELAAAYRANFETLWALAQTEVPTAFREEVRLARSILPKREF